MSHGEFLNLLNKEVEGVFLVKSFTVMKNSS